MTNEPKATLPDYEVKAPDKIYVMPYSADWKETLTPMHDKRGGSWAHTRENYDECGIQSNVVTYVKETTIRAHIAAQAEKISALEKKLSEQIREDEMRLINHCVKIVGNNSKAHIHAEAEFLTRIAELEAENKRLREALEELARLGGPHGGYGNSIGNQIAQAALAQTGEK